MRREVSAEDRVSGPEAGLSLRERKPVRYSAALPWRHLKTYGLSRLPAEKISLTALF